MKRLLLFALALTPWPLRAAEPDAAQLHAWYHHFRRGAVVEGKSRLEWFQAGPDAGRDGTVRDDAQ